MIYEIKFNFTIVQNANLKSLLLVRFCYAVETLYEATDMFLQIALLLYALLKP